MEQADLLLLDIKAADDALFRRLTGRGMENTLELLDCCENEGKPVWIRHVLVPGLTLEDEQLHRLGRLLQPYTCIQRVEALPFHKMGNTSGRSWGSRIPWRDGAALPRRDGTGPGPAAGIRAGGPLSRRKRRIHAASQTAPRGRVSPGRRLRLTGEALRDQGVHFIHQRLAARGGDIVDEQDVLNVVFPRQSPRCFACNTGNR